MFKYNKVALISIIVIIPMCIAEAISASIRFKGDNGPLVWLFPALILMVILVRMLRENYILSLYEAAIMGKDYTLAEQILNKYGLCGRYLT